jgi:muconate cycloisomerase
MIKIDQIETMILDIPTMRGHVLSMAMMRSQAAVVVRIRFSDGSEGIVEGTTQVGLLTLAGSRTCCAYKPARRRVAIKPLVRPQLETTLTINRSDR